MSIQFLIVDPHPLFRAGLSTLLHSIVPSCTVLEAAAADQLPERENEQDLRVILLNDRAGETVEGDYAGSATDDVIVMLTDTTPRRERRPGTAPAMPVLSKRQDLRAFARKIHQVLDRLGVDAENSGDHDASSLKANSLSDLLTRLTPRQMSVLALLSEGHQNKEIAYRLGLSEATVKHHVSKILQRLGLARRTQAVALLSTAVTAMVRASASDEGMSFSGGFRPSLVAEELVEAGRA